MRKPKIKNKYNLKFKDIKKLKIKDRSKIKSPLFWRNNVVKAWCISETTIQTKEDELYSSYNDYWIGIFDEDSSRKQKIVVKCSAYGGMANYNFKEFFNYKEIEHEDDLLIQEKLLNKINYLLDNDILSL